MNERIFKIRKNKIQKTKIIDLQPNDIIIIEKNKFYQKFLVTSFCFTKFYEKKKNKNRITIKDNFGLWQVELIEYKKNFKIFFLRIWLFIYKWYSIICINIKQFFYLIINFLSLKWLKKFIERGIKGYSKYDLWNLDIYLSGIIGNAVKELNEKKMSYPANLKEKEWDKILEKISKGFLYYSKNIFEKPKIARKKLKESLKLFAEYFEFLED